jgi:hypothetical protein
VLLSLVYIAIQLVLRLVALLFRSADSKELEIVVFGHELAILGRQVHRPAFRGDSPGVSVATALSWPLSDTDGRVTQSIRSAFDSSDLRIRH